MDLTVKIAQMVRDMSDEEIVKLVGQQLGQGSSAAVSPGNSRSVAPVARRRKAGRPAGKKAAKKAEKKTAPKKGNSEPLADETAKAVAKFVKRSKGVSVAEVAAKFELEKPAAASILKRLFVGQAISRGGERRFTRYAGDEDTAKLASLRARGKTAA